MRVFIAPLLLCLVSLVCVVLCLYDTAVPSPVWWFSSATCGLLGLFLISRKEKHEQARNIRLEVCKDALSVIQNEVPNFEQIIRAKTTGRIFRDLHQKAVEVYSFNDTRDALLKLQRYWRYRNLCRRALNEVAVNDSLDSGNKEVERLLQLLAALERKLMQETRSE